MAASAGNIPVNELPGLAQSGNSGWNCSEYPTQWDCTENLPGLDQLSELDHPHHQFPGHKQRNEP